MEKQLSSVICVDMSLFNKVLKYINSTSDICLDYNDKDYLVDKKDFDKVIKSFYSLLKEKEHDSFLEIKGADLSRYNKLKDDYDSKTYNNIRNTFNHVKAKKYSDEDILTDAVNMYDEIDNIKRIPSLIKEITDKLEEVKAFNLSDNINSINIKFKTLLNNGGLYEDYLNINKELDILIKKTYIENISTDKLPLIVSDKDNYKILTNENIDKFSYGYIYDPSNIKCVKNKFNKDKFICFEHSKIDDVTIDLNNTNPIGVYIISYGEKSLNKNYINAMELKRNKNIPLIELDITKIKPSTNINELIDSLVENKGITITTKDEEFYSRFDGFYKRYQKLKETEHDESRIINLFEAYFNYIFSQKYLDLDYLLKDTKEPNEIKEILENNIYYDFNIFKDSKINKTKLKRFYEVFNPYADNMELKRTYHGIDIILSEIKKADDVRIDEIVDIINKSSIKDSWLIAQTIKPSHRVSKSELATERVITDEEKLFENFVKLLKSQDASYTRSR